MGSPRCSDRDVKADSTISIQKVFSGSAKIGSSLALLRIYKRRRIWASAVMVPLPAASGDSVVIGAKARGGGKPNRIETTIDGLASSCEAITER